MVRSPLPARLQPLAHSGLGRAVAALVDRRRVRWTRIGAWREADVRHALHARRAGPIRPMRCR